MNAILKNDVVAYTVYAMLSFLGYYVSIKLMLINTITLWLSVACAVLVVGYDATYNYKLTKSLVPDYPYQYVATVSAVIATVVVAVAIPQAAAIYSAIVAVIFTIAVHKVKALDYLRDTYC